MGISHKIEVSLQTTLPDADALCALITRCACEVLAREGVGFAAQIDVTLVGDGEIRAANAAFRGKDAVTDVLSFPLCDYVNGAPAFDPAMETDPGTGRVLLGDMLMNYARACEQAQAFGHSPARECGYLTVHSVLHLLGYDHEREEDDARLMRRREEEALAALGLPRLPEGGA